jgi:hypothetical protein
MAHGHAASLARASSQLPMRAKARAIIPGSGLSRLTDQSLPALDASEAFLPGAPHSSPLKWLVCSNLTRRFCQFRHNKGLMRQSIENKLAASYKFSNAHRLIFF